MWSKTRTIYYIPYAFDRRHIFDICMLSWVRIVINNLHYDPNVQQQKSPIWVMVDGQFLEFLVSILAYILY